MTKRHIKPLTETEKAYLAGFFDGEGCIHIGKHQAKDTPTPAYNLYVVIAQTNRTILEEMFEMIGLGSIHVYKRTFENGKTDNTSYALHLSGRHAADFLAAIKDYIRLKKFQAEVALEFQATRDFKKHHHGRGSKVPPDVIEKREQLAQMLKADKKSQYTNANMPDFEPTKTPSIQRQLF